jgi:hypothetical protein
MACTSSCEELDPRENGGMGEPGLENTSGFDFGPKEVPLARRWPESGVDAMRFLPSALNVKAKRFGPEERLLDRLLYVLVFPEEIVSPQDIYLVAFGLPPPTRTPSVWVVCKEITKNLAQC